MMPFGNLLYLLTAYLLPKGKALSSPQIEQVTLHPRLSHIASCKPVVSSLQCNRMIPDDACHINAIHQVLIPPIAI
jgi:hypothetical protein